MIRIAAVCQFCAYASAGIAITFIAYPQNVIVQSACDRSANRPESNADSPPASRPPAISATWNADAPRSFR
jgi:hypothetical protein